MIKKVIIANLKTLTGLHIESGDMVETTDSPVYRDTNGDIVIPGTALAGALRALATRIAPHFGYKKCIALDENPQTKTCDCLVCNLFGSLITGKSSTEGKASKLWVYDSVLKSEPKTHIRDGVGIDRETGASSRRARAKFDFEVAPKDSVFSFKIAIQDELSEGEEKLLSFVLEEWRHGRGYLGGGIGRGLGNIQLEDIKVFSINLSNADNLIAFLQEDDEINVGDEDEKWIDRNIKGARELIKGNMADEYLYNSFLQMDMELKFTGGFLINDILNSVQSGFDFTPRIENGKFILPGSSFRGILRSHAEKIARSLVTLNSGTAAEFLSKCPACNPFADKDDPLASCNAMLREYKRVHKEEIQDDKLCLACQLFGSSFKGSRLYVSDGEMTGTPEIKIMDFLAIDRFTGGGKEGAKFDALVLWQPKFRLRIFLENPKDWQLGWLMLVIKDLKERLLSFGFGKNKWFGKATIEDGTIKVGAISELFIPSGLEKGNSYEDIFNTQVFKLKELIEEHPEPLELWVKEFHKVLSEFKRVDALVPGSDTYFKTDVSELYPKEVEI